MFSKLEKYLVLRHSFTESHNLSKMWTSYLFHKCKRCHVIETVVQLCMTVGLGIRLRSLSVKSWRWTSLRLRRNPRIAARVLLKRANLSLVLFAKLCQQMDNCLKTIKTNMEKSVRKWK